MSAIGLKEYIGLKSEIILNLEKSSNKKNIIDGLKDMYKGKINSRRRMDNISDAVDLIKILEKRDLLAVDDIKPFGHIVIGLGNPPELLDLIANYARLANGGYMSTVPTYHYPCNIPKVKQENETQVHNISTNVLKNRELVYELLSYEIGSYWRDFSRCLKIRECEIDRMNEKYPNDLQSKVWEILKLYEYKAEPDKWQYDLCNALEKCRRSDLKDKVNEIMIKKF